MHASFDWDTDDMSIMLLAKLAKPLYGTARIVINHLHIKGDVCAIIFSSITSAVVLFVLKVANFAVQMIEFVLKHGSFLTVMIFFNCWTLVRLQLSHDNGVQTWFVVITLDADA